ncbi:unnamed protein product [Pleuronectes platessa]|uniref:Uncharacterized protein n=1 Tax=Pleuronectes platessa TaxID=8262 RepID=A0A9N7YH79_PLEPL|nr:unnamed protein product [Pleuronectes platessa]
MTVAPSTAGSQTAQNLNCHVPRGSGRRLVATLKKSTESLSGGAEAGGRPRDRSGAEDKGSDLRNQPGPSGAGQGLEQTPQGPLTPQQDGRLPGPSSVGQGLELAQRRHMKPEQEWRLPGPSGMGQEQEPRGPLTPVREM